MDLLMAARRCQQCGTLIRTSRCRTCARAADKHRATLRGPRARPEYAGNWRYNSAQQRAQHIQLHGWNCFGLNHPGCPPIPPHPATDLVLDHDFGVMCRQCNAIKANTYDRHPHSPTTETRNTTPPTP
jgi:hypothetical protein